MNVREGRFSIRMKISNFIIIWIVISHNVAGHPAMVYCLEVKERIVVFCISESNCTQTEIYLDVRDETEFSLSLVQFCRSDIA